MEQRTDIRPHISMEQRKEITRNVCSDFVEPRPVDLENLTLVDMPPRLLISDRYKLLGCSIDKVGSTNLQRIFYILNGLTNETDPGKVPRGAARKHTNEFFQKQRPNLVAEVIPRLKSYTTFMFVRHPLERLVSAYRDSKPNGIFQQLRMNSTVPNFNKYIDILLQHKSHYSHPQRPLYVMCNPCKLRYDFIGSLDDFDHDLTTILRAVGAENAVTIPKRNDTGYRQTKSSVVFKSYYKDIPIDTIEKVEQIYGLDYALFGFENYRDIITVNRRGQ